MSYHHYPNYKKHLNQRILGLDYGEKVIGLASFCPGQEPFPLPYGKIENKNLNYVFEELNKVVQSESIEIFVLGLPLYLDGKESSMTKTVKKFAHDLNQKFPTIILYYQDETLSSFEAEERMKNSPRYQFKLDPKSIDALSASIILEDFMRKS